MAELGAKPSDLLQANGIIWVEGPSDRIYVNRFIEIFSEGKYREGRDFQCAYFGGSLLARVQFVEPQDEDAELANLLRINNNVAIICDSDRTSDEAPGSVLKSRVVRVREEVAKIPGSFVWITDGKEMENYLPGAVIGDAVGQSGVRNPERFEGFFRSEEAAKEGQSYLESVLGRKSFDKTEMALKISPGLTAENLGARFDLKERMLELIAKIESWNR